MFFHRHMAACPRHVTLPSGGGGMVADVWDEKIFDPLPLAAEHTAQIRDRVAVFGADQHKNFSCHRFCRAVLGDWLDGVEEWS